MLIRPFQKSDLDAVSAIEKASFSEPWSEESLLSEGCGLPYATMLVAEEEGAPVGYICLRYLFDEAEITNIAVQKDYRRRGIGEMLIDAAVSFCNDICCTSVDLEVRETNVPALALYEKKGFERVGIRKDYYEKPRENAVLMTATLS